MVGEPEPFLRALMPHNLVVAGRAAAVPGVRDRLSAAFLDELRWALVGRSRDPEADLRHRIACGYAVGDLGDPRWERRTGPLGAYLVPPMVAIPGGEYPIGDDDVIEWTYVGGGGTTSAHIPRHTVVLAPYEIGQFPVTNAEYACFVAAGGYEDERWWDTEDARRWRRGELANEAAKANNWMWRKRFLADAGLFEQMESEGRFPSAEADGALAGVAGAGRARPSKRHWRCSGRRSGRRSRASGTMSGTTGRRSRWWGCAGTRPGRTVVGWARSWVRGSGYRRKWNGRRRRGGRTDGVTHGGTSGIRCERTRTRRG